MDKFTVNVVGGSLQAMDDAIFLKGQELALAAQAAMGRTFYGVVMNNFGEAGEDRPHDWEMLSDAYSRKVGRPHATLYVSGALKEAVDKDLERPQGALVSADDNDIPYALVHQWGGGNNIPARPYFPVLPSGEVTGYTEAKCVEAAREAVAKELKR